MRAALGRRQLLRLALAGAAPAFAAGERLIVGRVVDARTGEGLALAHVAGAAAMRRSDETGGFALPVGAGAQDIAVRAPGYLRRALRLPALPDGPLTIALQPFRPKALYLSAYGIGSAVLRGDALRLVEQTELNALVIDVKGDASVVPYRSAALAAAGLAPQTVVTVADMPALLRSLREHGLYLIARIVVFKDQRLAAARPDWAVKTAEGAVWHDREGLAWVDPSRRESWALSLALAEEAAAMGFDEIQFDYVRFPDAAGLRFSRPDTAEQRMAAIAGFLDAARRRLERYNVFVAADIFGYVCWNTNDTQIGQQLEMLSDRIDYLSPMLYPSGFTWGIPGYRQAVAWPYEIVHHTLREALRRTGLSGLRWRPWLQAFRDYAFDRRPFGAHEIRAQIDAAEAIGTNGWMLWNAHNRYSADGLKPDPAARLARTGRP